MFSVRGSVSGEVQGHGLREATVERAGSLDVLGWVRHDPVAEDRVLFHAEGETEAVEALLAFLADGPAGARVEALQSDEVDSEGHEQFAIRGVSAGRFAVVRREPGAGPFALHLEVGGAVRAWALPKGPSMDPAVKRMAFEAAEPETIGAPSPVWDEGDYEQGGRVPWPEAIDRGHAVFVLHGNHLEGGFALQRIRRGDRPQWLLIKRADDFARRGSDVVEGSGG